MVLICMVSIGFLLYAKPGFAQQVTLSISPPIVETLIKPGKNILIGYTIQNLGDPTALLVKIRPFSPKGDYGEMRIDEEFSSPIRFSLENTNIQMESPFFLKQRDTTQALVRIRIPEGTPVGDYYFVILAEAQPAPKIGGSSSPLAKATIGSTLLLTVTKSGQTEAKGKIALLQIIPDYRLKLFGKEYQIVESQTQIPAILILQNLGSNLIKPNGELVLRGPMGVKTSYPLLPQNILSQSKRLIHVEESRTHSPTLSLTIPGYHIGPYSLSASVNFGEQTPHYFASTTFIGVPIKLMITVCVLFIVSLLIVRFFKKKKPRTENK